MGVLSQTAYRVHRAKKTLSQRKAEVVAQREAARLRAAQLKREQAAFEANMRRRCALIGHGATASSRE